jgi:hypothetical protein
MSSNEQVHNFLEFAKNIEEKIKNEITKKYRRNADTSHNRTVYASPPLAARALLGEREGPPRPALPDTEPCDRVERRRSGS